MISFVNAKINIGLNIVGKREDGYHLLETVFYPVGTESGTPQNTSRFCDMIELTEGRMDDSYITPILSFRFMGNSVDCPPEKNLVVKAGCRLLEELARREGGDEEFKRKLGTMTLTLYKQLPDGAGMGGGSADASFTLKMINDYARAKGCNPVSADELEEIAASLGADCPVFIKNRPAYAEGIGEKLEELPEVLKGKWIIVAKPKLHISTKEAFANVVISPASESLRELIKLPIEEWKGRIRNDFEDSLFPSYPELKEIKEALYAAGAEYASLTGSGAALYGIFPSEERAEECLRELRTPFKVKLLL